VTIRQPLRYKSNIEPLRTGGPFGAKLSRRIQSLYKVAGKESMRALRQSKLFLAFTVMAKPKL
jgi:hypothetical protein